MLVIMNSESCFVQLWLLLERTRHFLVAEHHRYCIRNILKVWFANTMRSDLIWEVCFRCEQDGWTEMRPPALAPRPHRELLRAIVSVRLGISSCKVNLRALDSAYYKAFPNGIRMNVNKKALA